jgi:6-hydroxymethylpterin diphosphokinase MptE-like/Methyltransferase domain
MLQVVCVRSDIKDGIEYVEILQDMIRRNIAAGTPGNFECFTDQPETIDGVDIRPTEGYGGWWDKIGLFKPGLWEPGERIWFFDLDMCIVRSLDEILKYDGPVAAWRDVWPRKGCFGSAPMTWRAGEMDHVFQRWNAMGRPRPPGGDQDIINQLQPDFVALQDAFPGAFVNYRSDAILGIPDKAVVVNFHGSPKPEEVKEGWVPAVWKVGGGTALELVPCGNTSMHMLKQQIHRAYDIGKSWVPVMEIEQGAPAMLVGGGPSIECCLPIIRLMAGNGATVFGLNNAANWLKQHGIQPHYQVMLDARPEMVDMILDDDECVLLAASQSNPPVQDKADYLWNAHFDGIDQFLPENDSGASAITVCGGSSVGLMAISLAYIMGYRKFAMFGYDSCYSGDKHHAYEQALNDGEKIIDVRLFGKDFKCAPWMAMQVKEFQCLATQLIELGCEISVYGAGLLQMMAAAMASERTDAEDRCDAILSRLNGASPVKGAEIGVSIGNLSVQLLKNRQDLELLLVDPYRADDSSGRWYNSGSPEAQRDQVKHEECYGAAMSRIRDITTTRGTFLRLPSVEAARYVADRSLDFAFIDADHTYAGCSEDILAWAPKIKPGGLLCGHDYDWPPNHPTLEVKRAVDEWAAANGHAVDLGKNTTWFVRIP